MNKNNGSTDFSLKLIDKIESETKVSLNYFILHVKLYIYRIEG